jgi:hypothetical protein
MWQLCRKAVYTCAALLKKSYPLVLLEPELWYENGAITA